MASKKDKDKKWGLNWGAADLDNAFSERVEAKVRENVRDGIGQGETPIRSWDDMSNPIKDWGEAASEDIQRRAQIVEPEVRREALENAQRPLWERGGRHFNPEEQPIAPSDAVAATVPPKREAGPVESKYPAVDSNTDRLASDVARAGIMQMDDYINQTLVRNEDMSEGEKIVASRHGEKDLYLTPYEANMKYVPSQIVDNIADNLDTPLALSNIRNNAAALNVTESEYVEKILLPVVENKVREELVRRKMPKNAIDAALSPLRQSIIGRILQNTAGVPSEIRGVEQEAQARYDEKLREEIENGGAAERVAIGSMTLGRMAVPFIADAGPFKLLGAVSNVAGLGRLANASMLSGNEFMATAARVGLREGGTFGLYEGISGLLDDAVNDEVKWYQALKNFGLNTVKGTAKGVGLGVIRAGLGKYYEGMPDTNGGFFGAAQTAGRATVGFMTEAGWLAAADVTEKYIENPATFNLDTVDWKEELLNSGLTVMMMKLSAATHRASKDTDAANIHFTEEDMAAFRNAGIPIAREGDLQKWMFQNADLYAGIPKEQQLWYRRAVGIFENKALSVEQKNLLLKKAGLMGNIPVLETTKVGDVGLYTFSDSKGNPVTRYRVDEFDGYGTFKKRTIFATEQEAQQYRAEIEEGVTQNRCNFWRQQGETNKLSKATPKAIEEMFRRGVRPEQMIEILAKDDKALTESERKVKEAFLDVRQELIDNMEEPYDVALYDTAKKYGVPEGAVRGLVESGLDERTEFGKRVMNDFMQLLEEYTKPDVLDNQREERVARELIPEGELEQLREEGRKLYASGDAKAMHEQVLRYNAAKARHEGSRSDMQLLKYYLRQKAIYDAMLETHNGNHSEAYSTAESVVKNELMADPDGNVRVVRVGDKAFVVLNADMDSMIVAPVETAEDGSIDFASADRSRARSVMRRDAGEIELHNVDEVMRSMYPNVTAERDAIFGDIKPEVGQVIETVADEQGNVVRETVAGTDGRGTWMLQGEDGFQRAVTEEDLTKMLREQEQRIDDERYFKEEVEAIKAKDIERRKAEAEERRLNKGGKSGKKAPVVDVEDVPVPRDQEGNADLNGMAEAGTSVVNAIDALSEAFDGDLARAQRVVAAKVKALSKQGKEAVEPTGEESGDLNAMADAARERNAQRAKIAREQGYWLNLLSEMTGRRKDVLTKDIDNPDNYRQPKEIAREQIENLAEKLGVKVVFTDNMYDTMMADESITDKPKDALDAEGYNGYRRKDGTIVVNMNSEHAMVWTMGHETGHQVEAASPQQYEVLKAAVLETLDPLFVAQKMESLRGEEVYKNSTDRELLSEIANDGLGRIFTDEKAFGELMQRLGVEETKTLSDRIKSWVEQARKEGVMSALKQTWDSLTQKAQEANPSLLDGERGERLLSLAEAAYKEAMANQDQEKAGAVAPVRHSYDPVQEIDREGDAKRLPEQMEETKRLMAVKKDYEKGLQAGRELNWRSLGRGGINEISVYGLEWGLNNRILGHRPNSIISEGADGGRIKVNMSPQNLVDTRDHIDALERLQREYVTIRKSPVATDEARRVIDSNIYAIDYAKRYYDLALQGDNAILKMEAPQFSKEDGPVFLSNARTAIENIKQEKATAEQWLAMAEKAGGIKAGEDKWLGLSDWLRSKKGEKLTREDILNFIRENQIEIEDVNYSEMSGDDIWALPAMKRYSEEFKQRIEETGNAAEAFDTMVSDYGDDFASAFEYDNNELSPTIDWDGELSGAARYYLDIDRNVINGTRLSFTTEGLTNKREIALVVPTIEPYNQGDAVHFGDAGDGRAVAWVRFGDANKIDESKIKEAAERARDDYRKYLNSLIEKYGADYKSKKTESEKRELWRLFEAKTKANGAVINGEGEVKSRILVLDEIQSKRHQDGRENGYLDPALVSAVSRMNELERKMYSEEGISNEEYAELQELHARGVGRASWGMRSKVPDAPFDKNWHELAMKRMLRFAAENGYDKLAWTTGAQQAERYDIGAVIDQVERTQMFGDTGETRYDLQPRDNSGGISLFVKDGKVTQSSMDEFEGKPLEQVVGKELAAKMLEMKDYSSLNIADMPVGGEGMRGFYDEILPRFMNKYCKKWGVKVGEVELDNVEEAGRRMWSVDITPEMRESVMRGQPMFSKDEKRPIFLSNAETVVRNIKQDKATAEQWLAMAEKMGGIKAGEDKWMGLSDWLRSKKGEKLTKDEVLKYIMDNSIQVEEEHYSTKGQSQPTEKYDREFKKLIETAPNETGYDDIFGLEKENWAWNQMIEKYGEDFEKAFEHDGDDIAARTNSDGEYLYPELIKKFWGDKAINDIRLGYTTRGLVHKREIALVVPTIEPYTPWDDVHFGDAGDGRAVAWVRFGETKVRVDELRSEFLSAEKAMQNFMDEMKKKYGWDDFYEEDLSESDAETFARLRRGYQEAYRTYRDSRQNVLVVDEVQSKIHQDGRELGYYNKHLLEKLKARADKAYQDFLDFARKKGIEYGYRDWYSEPRSTAEGFDFSKVNPEDRKRYNELFKAWRDADMESYQYEKSHKPTQKKGALVPDAPFDKNWHEVAMKRMLRYAAENGYDKLAWTTGEQQMERYNLSKKVDEIIYKKNDDGTYQMSAIYESRGHLLGDAITEDKLPEFVGKELAQKIVAGDGYKTWVSAKDPNDTSSWPRDIQEEWNTLSGGDLRIGGEGMKGFYDEILPRFMNKYGKKWGVKVYDIELPNAEEAGRHMWAVDITPEMKESVMQGQVMFSKEDEEFNRQIDNLNEKNKDNIVLSLGRPSKILVDAGVQDKPMKLYGNKLLKKQKKHGFKLEELYNLPSAVADPIAVFNNYKTEGNRSVLTELKTKNGNFLISVELGKDGDVDFNVVLSVFGKGGDRIEDWFKRGYSTYINEKKVKDFLSHQSAPIAAAAAKSSPYLNTKVRKLFELNKLFGEKLFIRTNNFKKWFGDWEKEPQKASKVVDENGEPLVVYHGTNSTEEKKTWNEEHGWYDTEHKKFNVFRTTWTDGNPSAGHFFVADENNAGGYGNTVYPVYLNIRKPLVIDCKGANFASIEHNGKRQGTYDWAEEAQVQGYDGVIFKNIRDGVDMGSLQEPVDEYVVFESTQIKAATENTGRFDGKNPDIRFSKENAETLFKEAKKRFGRTYDLREAGYILPDGTMLNFSGKHWMDNGADASSLAGRRTVDHRDIRELAYERDGNTKTGIETDMTDFIRSGAIRIDDNAGLINLSSKPTPEQRELLRRLVSRNGGQVQVEIGDGDMSEAYVEYDNAKPSKVLADIDRYFDEGIVPQGDVQFSKEDFSINSKKTSEDDWQIGEKFVSLHSERDREAVREQRNSMSPTAQWREGVGDVAIHSILPIVRKKYADLHEKAKAGDVEAAFRLVKAVVKEDRIKALAEQHPNAKVAFVHAEEATGENRIPEAYARLLTNFGFGHTDIVQTNKPQHTGSDRIGRLIRRARFDGDVEAGTEYILVDDHVTMGGTLRDLKDYIESKGGKVVAVTTLTASAGGSKLQPTAEQIEQLKQKGITNEQLKELGIADDIAGLTKGEARELLVLADARADRRPASGRPGDLGEARRSLGGREKDNGQGVDYSKETPAPREGEDWKDYAGRVSRWMNQKQRGATDSQIDDLESIRTAIAETDTNPSEAEKKSGNYKMGHAHLDGYQITIENPAGSVRRGTDPDGKAWESQMHYTYGYIRGTKGKDGDHVDIFLSENPTQGNVYVVDQVDPKTGKFDEHKVMYGFQSEAEARDAYLSNYEEGWKGLGDITGVSKEEFHKWVDSSKRKTKPFKEYANIETIKEATVADKAPEPKEGESPLEYSQRVIAWKRTQSEAQELSDGEVKFSKRTKDEPKKKGIGYKVFYLKDGKLYPPMVANPGGEDTPMGVWLDADAAPVVAETKSGRKKVKAGGKGTQGGSGQLAYRPGWHLGEIPYASQFNRENAETGEKELFPARFVWAEVEYANDVDYQKEAESYGMTENGKFRHSYAGLPRVPEDGAYKYRTNPDPNTDPWIITGAMRVNRLLTPSEVDEMVTAAGREPQKREQGAVTDAEIEALNSGVRFSKNTKRSSAQLDLFGNPQLDLFRDRQKDKTVMERIRELADGDLLQEIGGGEMRDWDFYQEEYDRRHNNEYGEEVDSYTGMLMQGKTSLNDAYRMYADIEKRWRSGGYATEERTALRAQMDALTDYIDRLEFAEGDEVQGLEGYTRQEVLDAVRGDVEEMLEDSGIDVEIKGMALNGSRLRGDARKDSDLDVVLEYDGDVSEDALFNILNENPIEFDGIKVDINPITEGKSGTLEQYMARSRQYDEEVGVRFSKEIKDFEERQLRAVEENGTVTPNLEGVEIKVVDVPKHKFAGTGRDALVKASKWANENLNGRHVAHKGQSDEFEYLIDSESIRKFLSQSSTKNSENLGVHLAVLTKLPQIIDNSVSVEVHPDYKKINKVRKPENGVDDVNLLVQRMYGAAKIDGSIYRVKTTMHEHKSNGRKPHDYRVTKIELIISGSSTSDALNSSIETVDFSTIPATKLLQNVEKSYDKGKFLLEKSKNVTHFSKESDIKKGKSELWKRTWDEVKDNAHYRDMMLDLEPHTIEEVAAGILRGGGLLWGDVKDSEGKVLVKGVRSFMGYKEGERKKFFGLFTSEENGGRGFERVGEEVETECQRLGIPYDENDPMAGVNALQSVLSECGGKGQLNDYIQYRRVLEVSSQIKADEDAEQEAIDEEYYDRYGMDKSTYDQIFDEVSGEKERRKSEETIDILQRKIEQQNEKMERMWTELKAERTNKEGKAAIERLIQQNKVTLEENAALRAELNEKRDDGKKLDNTRIAMERRENIRKQLIDYIREQVASEWMPFTTKRDLNRLMSAVQQATTPEALEKAMRSVQYVSMSGMVRAQQQRLDRLMALKVQDVNGKNMSIAKNVDDRTRVILQGVRQRVLDNKMVSLMEQLDGLRRDRIWFNAGLRKMRQRGEEPEVIAEEEAKLQRNAERMADLEQQIEDLREQKPGTQEGDIQREIAELNKKADNAATGEAVWTAEDADMMTQLQLMQALVEPREYTVQEAELGRELSQKIDKAKELMAQRNAATDDAVRHDLTDKIKAEREIIEGLQDARNEALKARSEALSRVIELFQNTINGGKESLQAKVQAEAERRMLLIREAVRSVGSKESYDFNTPQGQERADNNTKEGVVKKYVGMALGNFDYMCRKVQHEDGRSEDGWFYKTFVSGKEGAIEAYNAFEAGKQEQMDALNAKVEELWGKKREANKTPDEKNGIYRQFKGKMGDAVRFLISKREGIAKAVFTRKETGDIDVIWGNGKAGLRHIIEKHVVRYDDFNSVEDAVKIISDVVINGQYAVQKDGRAAFVKDNYRVAIEKGEDGSWIITALDTSRKKAEKKRSEQDATRLHQSIFGEENGELVSPQLATRVGKGSEKIIDEQENARNSSGNSVNSSFWDAFRTDAWIKQAAEADKVEEHSGVTIRDGRGLRQEIPLTKGAATYIWARNRMPDGRCKLEAMGYDAITIDQIEHFIGPKYIELAKWVSDEFLVNARAKYNERYRDIYNTSMARIEHYVPMSIYKEGVRKSTDMESGQAQTETLDRKAGALTNRVFNLNPLDVRKSFFEVIKGHVEEMEEWYAYVKLRRDLDSILSNTHFRNQINANSAGDFQRLRDAAAVATLSYTPMSDKYDALHNLLTKGAITGAIANRWGIAIKQLLSGPATAGYALDLEFGKALLKNLRGYGGANLKWCYNNMPSFRKRVDMGDLGDTRISEASPKFTPKGKKWLNWLLEYSGEKISQGLKKYASVGMVPNRIVDAITCSVCIKTIYDYNFNKITKGLADRDLTLEERAKLVQEADRRAKMEADIYYNQTQQSSHPVFVSPMQLERTFAARMFTIFQNSNLGYTRKMVEHAWDLWKHKDYKKFTSAYTRMYLESGMTKEEAEKAARIKYWKSMGEDAWGMTLYGYGLKLLWNIGGQALFGMFQTDDKEKKAGETQKQYEKRMGWDSFCRYATLVFTPFQGTAPANLALNAIAAGGRAYGSRTSGLLMVDAIADWMRDINASDVDPMLYSAITFNHLSKAGGVDFETLGRIYIGVEGLIRKGYPYSDYLIDIMYLLGFGKANRGEVARSLFEAKSWGWDPVDKARELFGLYRPNATEEEFQKVVGYADGFMTHDGWLAKYMPGVKDAEGERYVKEHKTLSDEYQRMQNGPAPEKEESAAVRGRKAYRTYVRYEDIAGDADVEHWHQRALDTKKKIGESSKEIRELGLSSSLTKQLIDVEKMDHEYELNIADFYADYNKKRGALIEKLTGDKDSDKDVLTDIRRLREDFLSTVKDKGKLAEKVWDIKNE